jgi:hypothetical protein
MSREVAAGRRMKGADGFNEAHEHARADESDARARTGCEGRILAMSGWAVIPVHPWLKRCAFSSVLILRAVFAGKL